MRVFGCWKAGKIEKEAVAVVNIDNRKWLMYNKNKLIMLVYWRSLSPRAPSVFLSLFWQQKKIWHPFDTQLTHGQIGTNGARP